MLSTIYLGYERLTEERPLNIFANKEGACCSSTTENLRVHRNVNAKGQVVPVFNQLSTTSTL
jgi:hypothetical protein